MPQVRIELDDTLYAVLERLADEECRLPTGQATWLVRQALRTRMQEESAAASLPSQVHIPTVWAPELSETLPKEATP